MEIKKTIAKVVEGKNLTEKETRAVFNQIMTGKATPAQIGALITALRIKGETVDEITGAAKVMREKASAIKIKSGSGGLLDTCGTGGAGTHAFNISTAVAFVVAGCGVKVAKHGNRAVSSHCGSADVLEKLGVKIDVPIRVTEKCINTIGIGFLFAPLYHRAMKHAIAPRREIGLRTIFNILGPLSHPASAKRQVLGVYDKDLTELMAKVLNKLGTKHAFVVHGSGPLDEVSASGKTKISELKSGRVKTYTVSPRDFGIKASSLRAIKGGSAKDNAKIIKDILSGKKGPKRDVVLMNASIALIAAGKARSLKEGVSVAARSIDSGKAKEKLKSLADLTNK